MKFITGRKPVTIIPCLLVAAFCAAVWPGFALAQSSDTFTSSSPAIFIASSNYVDSAGARSGIRNNKRVSTAESANTDSTQPAPAVRFLSETMETTEGSESGVTIVIENPDNFEVNVDVYFHDEESNASEDDFSARSPVTVTFLPAASNGDSVTVFKAVKDDHYEGKETAFFTLGNLRTQGSARIADPSSAKLIIKEAERPDVVINELLANPRQDANGDGVVDTESDRFVEIVNNEPVTVSLAGWTLIADNRVIHNFNDSAVIEGNGSVVLFDNTGNPSGSFGGATVLKSGNKLNISSSNGNLRLNDDQGYSIDQVSYQTIPPGYSLARVPDRTGGFAIHGSVVRENAKPFSPGVKLDGTDFITRYTIPSQVGWHLLAVPPGNFSLENILDNLELSTDGKESVKRIITGYDGSAFSTASDITADLTAGKGLMIYLDERTVTDNRPLQIDDIGQFSTNGTNETITYEMHQSGEGWNLLGNPFPSSLDIRNISEWVDDSLHTKIAQFWDPAEQTFLLSTSNKHMVPGWRGFFLQNKSASRIEIPNPDLVESNPSLERDKEQGYLSLKLEGEDEAGDNKLTDRASILYFHEDARNGWDLYDAGKLTPLTNRYALLSIMGKNKDGNALLAQDSRPFDFQGELRYDMSLNIKDAGSNFNLSWTLKDLPDDWNILLIDNENGTEIDMKFRDSYPFRMITGRRGGNEMHDEQNRANALPPKLPLEKGSGQSQPRFTIMVTKNSQPPTTQSTNSEIAQLNPNYPNPFDNATTINYELTQDAKVLLSIWNIVGQKVETLIDVNQQAGEHDVVWNASNLPSGFYIAQLEVNGKVFIRKMTLIK